MKALIWRIGVLTVWQQQPFAVNAVPHCHMFRVCRMQVKWEVRVAQVCHAHSAPILTACSSLAVSKGAFHTVAFL